MDDSDDLLKRVFATVGIIAVAVLLIVQCVNESNRRDWIRHHCTRFRHEAGQVWVHTRDTSAIGSTDDRDCYRCPDGVEECF